MAIADTFNQTQPVHDAGDLNRPIVCHTDFGDFYHSENFSIDDLGPNGLFRIIDNDRIFWVNVDRIIWIGPRS